MAAKRGRVENLIPQSRKTKEEQRRIASLGGKKSVEVRREKKRMSELYAEFLEDEYDIELTEGERKKLSGAKLLKEVMKRVVLRSDSASVSMMKEIREGTEGSKVALSGENGAPLEINIKYVD